MNLNTLLNGSNNQNEDSKHKTVWTTEKVNSVVKAMEKGYDIHSNPFFEGDPFFRSGNIVFEYTKEEMDEIKKCARDIVHFANHYCHVMTDEGYQQITLRDYQIEMLKNYQANRFNICLAPRQVGKTICSGIFLTWYLLFHFDKNVLLMSNKGATTTEIMDKIKEIVKGLPFFLKPGTMKKDVMKMVFDNGCRIIAQNTTKNAGIGFTIHLLFLDEFAHVPDNIKESFYENVYPTLSSSNISRIIITSTPNGYDLFQRLFDGAVKKDNEYHPFRVDWWQIPGRDEEWKRREIAQLGSEEAFNKQYGCEFLSAESLLLDSTELRKIMDTRTQYEFREFNDLDDLGLDYSGFKWDVNFDEEELTDHSKYFIFSIDLAEGLGRDYSVMNIFRVDPLPLDKVDEVYSPSGIFDFFRLTQVACFSTNLLPVDDFAKIVYSTLIKIFDQDNCRLVIEYNNYGAEFIRCLYTMYPETNDFDEESIVRYYHKLGSTKKRHGIRHTGETKKIQCEKTKRYLGMDRLVVTDPNTADEWNYFSRKKNGSYAAQSGHDDLVMSCVNVGSFLDTLYYKEIVEEIMDEIDPDIAEAITKAVDGYEDGEGSLYDIFSDM